MSIKNIIACFFFILSLTGCSSLYDTFVYQIDITQGNYIDDKKLDQLELGMNQQQVIYLVGSPMLVDQFDSSKWYYIRYIKPGGEATQQQQVVLTFTGTSLAHIERVGQIAENPLKDTADKKEPNPATESSESDDQAPVTENPPTTNVD